MNIKFPSKVQERKKVALFFGGRSSEHEISIISALQLAEALDTRLYEIIPVYIDNKGFWFTGKPLLEKSFYKDLKALKKLTRVTLLPEPSIQGLIPINEGRINLNEKIPIDVCLLSFHGSFGEDGCIQGLLENAQMAYTGCAVTSSALSMDKYACKMYLKAHGIPSLPGILTTRDEMRKDPFHKAQKIIDTLGLFPLFVKPNHLGSSIGIGRASTQEELMKAIWKALDYDHKVLIEPCVTNLVEFNISVIDTDPLKTSVIEMPIADGTSLTYEDKYLKGGKKTGSSGMASLSRIINPQNVSTEIKEQISVYAKDAYKLLDCQGVVRFDFMLDKTANVLYFNEINLIPGSFAFYLWEETEPPLSYTDFIDHLIQRAEKRRAERTLQKTDIGFIALKN